MMLSYHLTHSLLVTLNILIQGQLINTNCEKQFIYDAVCNHNWPTITFLVSQSSEFQDGPQRRLLLYLSSLTISTRIIGLDHLYHDFHHHNREQCFILRYTNNLLRLLQILPADVASNNAWLVLINKSHQLYELKNVLKISQFFLNSHFYVADVSSCHTSVKIYGLYKVGERVEDVIVERGGPWTMNYGFDPPHLYEDFLLRRSDLRGYPMKAIGVDVFPHFTEYLSDHSSVSGYVGDIVMILKKTHNFTLTYSILGGYAYGKLIDDDAKTNNWTGMVGALQNRQVDLTISELSITEERTQVISYTNPIYIISRKMYVVTRMDNRRKILAYTTPMSPALFIIIFVTVSGLAVILTFMSYIQQVFIPPGRVIDRIHFHVATWYMVSALLQQGATSTPVSISSRMVFWYGFVLSMVIYTSYSATLVAILAVIRPEPLPFSDFYGLVQHADTWDAGNVKNDLFEVTASQTCANSDKNECQILQNLWNNIVLKNEENLVSDYSEGLARAKDRKYVFIGVDVTTNFYIKQLPPMESCNIKELPPRHLTGGIGIGVQHNSPFLPMFDESLQKLKEMGIMEKLVRKYLEVDTTCDVTTDVSADLLDVSSLFLILIAGIGISVVILMLETLINVITNRI